MKSIGIGEGLIYKALTDETKSKLEEYLINQKGLDGDMWLELILGDHDRILCYSYTNLERIETPFVMSKEESDNLKTLMKSLMDSEHAKK